jgi:hypothetical protein
MEKLVIQEAHKNCPGIFFYQDTKILEISGRSIPENPELIFKRLDDWMTGYFEKNNSMVVNILLEYINSGSSKYLYEILKKLTVYSKTDKQVVLKWFYEEDDDAMLELGEHYRDTAGIPLKIEMIV